MKKVLVNKFIRTIMLKKYRFAFVKDGTATDWIDLPLKQAKAVARKTFVIGFGLWNQLMKTNRIQIRCQTLDNGHWIHCPVPK